MLLLTPLGCKRRSEDTAKGEQASQATQPTETSDSKHAAIYDRAEAKAKRAVMYKPRDAEGGRAEELAPLIVYDVTGDLEGYHPVVLASLGRVIVNGDERDVITYRWDAPDAKADKQFALRIVLDDRGFAAFYEISESNGESKPRVFFVSRSMEEAAAEQFGGVLEGRRFATEPSLKEHPEIVVARMLEDGPQPMGPIVLIDGAKDEIFSLSCRCMPSQIEEIVRSDYYDLVVEPEDDVEAAQAIDLLLRFPDDW